MPVLGRQETKKESERKREGASMQYKIQNERRMCWQGTGGGGRSSVCDSGGSRAGPCRDAQNHDLSRVR